MKKYKCIGRYRSGDSITGYRLVDEAGNVKDVPVKNIIDALSTGEAIIANLVLGSDGKLKVRQEMMPENAIVPKEPPVESLPPEKQAENSKIISFNTEKSYLTGGALLDKLFKIFESNPQARLVRIVECEYGKEEDEAYAFVVIQNRTKKWVNDGLFSSKEVDACEDILFRISKLDNNSAYLFETNTGSYEADTLDCAIDSISEDLDTLISLNAMSIRKIGSSMVDSYESSRRIRSDFGLQRSNSDTVKVVGNNVVYLKSNRDVPVIVIPDYITVIANGAFDYNYNLKQIKCPTHLFRTINSMINARKVFVERV